jgi:hypothetical protein
MGMWWLSGDVVAQWGCGGSVGGCGGSVLGMWWLRWIGDVVAQLAKRQSYTRLQRSSSGFDPGIPYSLLRGGRNNGCVLKINSQDVRRPFLSKKKVLSLLEVDFTHTDLPPEKHFEQP